jgi:hypothetical protein
VRRGEGRGEEEKRRRGEEEKRRRGAQARKKLPRVWKTRGKLSNRLRSEEEKLQLSKRGAQLT